jgi:hypothetical protein
MQNHTHRNVLVALRDWFAAQQDGSEQAAAAALRNHCRWLPKPADIWRITRVIASAGGEGQSGRWGT